jgi:hypothetical protein
MDQILTPELIDLITKGVAGGFSAYHGVMIALYVIGKISEKRKAKKQNAEEEENTKERKRLGRLLAIVGSVLETVKAVENPSPSPPASPPETVPTPSPDVPVEEHPSEAVSLEEIIAKVISSIKK